MGWVLMTGCHLGAGFSVILRLMVQAGIEGGARYAVADGEHNETLWGCYR